MIPNMETGLSLKAVRLYYELDTVRDTLPYSKRPKCKTCKRKVIGHSYFNFPNEVICHECAGWVHRSKPARHKQPVTMKPKPENKPLPPPHPCAGDGCSNQVVTPKVKYCKRCAAIERERIKNANQDETRP